MSNTCRTIHMLLSIVNNCHDVIIYVNRKADNGNIGLGR